MISLHTSANHFIDFFVYFTPKSWASETMNNENATYDILVSFMEISGIIFAGFVSIVNL